MHEEVQIQTDYITLGQFIKLLNILDSGGMVKAFIQDVGAVVNGELEHRRGRKLYPEDIIEIEEFGSYIVKKEA
ncbi:S4 domain-containing protein YaaA [Oceanobacillus halophilus]|uniref:S4 domain-containing protein YaaA n=1 Tax=Oceanobacillus halophilus TaxID=930130 RepID=A0A495A170_9BACI|nr:S4 domain-containing protein YaaA [Oceanobacillus halophilus]RKQ33057.1 S4 domain-containing protein YaaA [Oceanobacillus halophilus]